jgi:hypothetical protein
MFRKTTLLLAVPALLVTALAHGALDRTIEERLDLRPGDRVEVRVTGAPLHLQVSDDAAPRVQVRQKVRGADAAAAKATFAAYPLTVTRDGEVLKVQVESPRRSLARRHGFSQSMHLHLPATVEVLLHTAGGPIEVTGRHSGRLVAETSGGGITLDETTGEAQLKSGGGAIRVNAVYGRLQAHTSGGAIRVIYVAPEAELVDVMTQGGSIALGVHPAGNWDLHAEATGGGVTIRNLPFASSRLPASGSPVG